MEHLTLFNPHKDTHFLCIGQALALKAARMGSGTPQLWKTENLFGD